MPAEPAVPVVRLEKLRRSLSARAGWHRRESLRESRNRNAPGHVRRAWTHQAVREAYRDAAAALRAIIDEAKGETR